MAKKKKITAAQLLDDGAPSEIDEWKLRHLKAQTSRAAVSAQQKQLELEIKKETLIQKAAVELDAATVAVNVSGALQRLPVRVAASCVGLTAEQIAEKLRREIELVIQEIQRSAFTGEWK